MFIISKRNFLVRRADGSPYRIKKDYIGEIPQDVYESALIQGAIKGGLVAAPESRSDKSLREAEKLAGQKEAETDIRPDAEAAVDVKPNTKSKAKQQ